MTVKRKAQDQAAAKVASNISIVTDALLDILEDLQGSRHKRMLARDFIPIPRPLYVNTPFFSLHLSHGVVGVLSITSRTFSFCTATVALHTATSSWQQLIKQHHGSSPSSSSQLQLQVALSSLVIISKTNDESSTAKVMGAFRPLYQGRCQAFKVSIQVQKP